MVREFGFDRESKVLNSEPERGPGHRKASVKQNRDVKITMRPIVLLTLLAVPVLMLLPVGHATTTTCTGTTSNAFVPTGPPTNAVINQVNGFTITTENFGLCFTGAFNGTTQGTVTIVVNTSTGNGFFFGQNTFTGTVTTSSGSGSGTVFSPFAATFSNGSFQGVYSVYGGTSGLANLHGFGTIQGSLTTFVGIYTANLFISS
jgi:hypothetical protein